MEAKAKTMEKMKLTSLLIYLSGTPVPDGTTHSGLDRPNQLAVKKMPPNMPQRGGGNPLIEVSSSQECQVDKQDYPSH